MYINTGVWHSVWSVLTTFLLIWGVVFLEEEKEEEGKKRYHEKLSKTIFIYSFEIISIDLCMGEREYTSSMKECREKN